jgi:membrane-associated phospholipid phosphatase
MMIIKMTCIRVNLILFACFILSIHPLNAQNADINILKEINPRYPTSDYWVQTSASAFWVSGAVLFGSLGYGLLRPDKKIKFNAYELAINIVISTGLTELLKKTINRERPGDGYQDEVFVNGVVHGESFPSGHTSLAFATAMTVSLDYRHWYIVVPAFLWAGSVGYSRMYLGKHYPSDVLAGAAIGIGSGYLSHWLTKKLFRDKHSLYANPN